MKEKTKNWILLIAICTFTIFLLFIALKLNEKRLNELSTKSIVGEYLNEVKYKEIDAFVIENPNAIIYVSDSSDEESVVFEKKFKSVIKKYNLENEIVYININEVNVVDAFYQNAPQIIFYKNNEVSDIIDCTTFSSKNNIEKELKERSVISD